MSPPARCLGLRPQSIVRGAFRAPGSKSLAQRALVIASLSDGATRIAGLPAGDDVAAAKEFALVAGSGVDELAPAAVRVRGSRPGRLGGGGPTQAFEAHESGTLTRFALAALAFCGRPGTTVELRPTETMLRRRTDALMDALECAGVVFERREWPVKLRPIGPPSTVTLRRASSSQEASALAIALSAWPGEFELRIEGPLPSAPYFEMTLKLLERFGVRCARRSEPGRELVRMRGPLRPPDEPLAIEPDASLAAVALAAGCLSGGEVTATGLGGDSLQGDVAIVEHLAAFGCHAVRRTGGIVASGFPQHAAELDLSAQPDLAPVLAIVAAGAALVDPSGASELRGLDTLPGKESSRIEVLAAGLRGAGWIVESTSTSLRISAATSLRASTPVELDPAGDHRMAFAFALLGLLRPGVAVLHPECVSKSWPAFWSDLAELGARDETGA
jgi:3-phosphoshikimate 1-carboxyvinyltransferase